MFLKTVLLFYFLTIPQVFGQVLLKGSVVNGISKEPLAGVRIRIEEDSEFFFTNNDGDFNRHLFFKRNLTIICELNEFKDKRIVLKKPHEKQLLDLGIIELEPEDKNELKESMIEVSQETFEEGEYEIVNISGLLSSRKDVFSRTAAFDFGSNFFRRRFLGSEQGLVMLNGVRLNKLLNGRPEWSNWGGLNDALRKQEVFPEMLPAKYALGGMAKSINMLSGANIQRKGLKISLSAANKNYKTRMMITYATGLLKKNWSVMASASFRMADTGFRQGTKYQANSFLFSIDKNISQKHHINATFIYANNQRGKSSPLTEEVFQLKDHSYNSYWGYQSGKKRNSRVKKILEPIFQLNYYFNVNPKLTIDTHLTYQKGQISSSRLDYSGSTLLHGFETSVGKGTNPDATYYQKLPSYFLRSPLNTDFAKAFLAEREFENNGQIDWNSLYRSNRNQSEEKNSIYVLFQDVDESESISFKTSFSYDIQTKLLFEGSFYVRNFDSEHYAFMTDLLGGKGYLDIDSFSDKLNLAQNNLLQPNRIVVENERFRYNFELSAFEFRSHIVGTYTSRKSALYVGLEFSGVNYQRNGIYENGRNPGSLSLGKSKPANFTAKSIKMGYSYRFSGRHIVSANANYIENAPVLKNIFTNVRESNNLVSRLTKNASIGIDLNYTWRHPVIFASLSGYYLKISDDTNISFYYADGLTGLENQESSAYVQEVLTGIDRLNAGLELAFEVKVLSGLKLKTVVALGHSVFTSNPNLYLTSNSIEQSLDMGASRLKGYFASTGPQNAFSFGFEYSSPKYWWLSTSMNIFDNSFISVAPITRTKNFFVESDGVSFQEFDPDIASALLRQEALDPYWNLNIVGGKSWKIKDIYVGFFLSVNNLMNTVYKTGGYEQSRNANYQSLLLDSTREKPLFGSKYWFGYGNTFFTSIYIRI